MIRPYRGVYPEVHPSAYVDETAQLIGHVSIGEDSSVWMNVVIRGDVNRITIRDYSERYVGYCLDYMQQA